MVALPSSTGSVDSTNNALTKIALVGKDYAAPRALNHALATILPDQRSALQLDADLPRIVLLSPQKGERRTALDLIGAILAHDAAADHAVYYSPRPRDYGDLWAFAVHFAEAAAEADPEYRIPWFGGSVQSITEMETAERIGAAVGAAFGRTRIRLVVLDEIDRLWEVIVHDTQGGPIDLPGLTMRFLVALAGALPPTVRLVLNTRSLDLRPWQDLIAQGIVQPAFTPPGVLTPRMEVYAFGTGSVFADGRHISDWDGQLPRTVFFFFVDKPLLTREEIFQTFWPEMNARDATNVFHVIKRKVADRLSYDPIVYRAGRYRRSQDIDCYYDVAEYEACVERFQDDPDDIRSMERAVALQRAPFLYGAIQPWATVRREALTASLIQALIGLGAHYRQDAPPQALSYFLRAARIAPLREDIARQVIGLYAEVGDFDAAVAYYRVLETRLQRAFHIAPDRATRALYESIAGSAAR